MVIRLAAFGVIFAAMALWEVLAPRRALSVGRGRRWPGNLGILAGRRPDGAAAGSDRRGRRGALRRRQRHRACSTICSLRLSVAALLGFLALDLVDLRAARRVPQRAGAVAAAPHAPRRSRHRRHHRRALPPDRDPDLAAIKIAVILALGIPLVAVILFEVVLNATSMFNHSNASMPAVARSRAAPHRGDAGHAPRASFDPARARPTAISASICRGGTGCSAPTGRSPRPATPA